MSVHRPSRATLVVALACALWVAAFLRDERPSLYALTPLVFLAMLAVRDRPVLAAAGAVAAQVLGAALGVPLDSPALLAPFLVGLYAVGRYAPARRGVLVLSGAVLAVQAVEASLGNALFALLLLGPAWAFGLLVRRRTEAARTARARARELEGQDPALLSQRVVAEERARLARDVVRVVHDAVQEMRELATAADSDLDPVKVDAISSRGREAVSELRRLLGLLRTEPAAENAPDAAPAGVWRSDALVGLVALVLAGVDTALVPRADYDALGVLLLGALCGSLVLRRTAPVLACAVAIAAVAGSVILPAVMPHGLADTVVLVLLSWTAASAADRWAPTMLTLLAGVELLTIWREDPGNVAITAAMFALPAFAGHAWSERDRDARAADADAAMLQSRLAEEVASAVTAERLRIAREVHDVSSHAVGVMVLHAGAARSQLERDPDASRAALATVVSAGSEALADLGVLAEVLETGAAEDPDGVPRAGGALGEALQRLRLRMEASGLGVDLRLESLPAAPDLVATTYRVVQEALTNVARHAPGAAVRVLVRHHRGGLLIRVDDDGAGRPERADSGSGFGLTGLAERVRAHGGDLLAGPRAAGGFTVEATVPPVAAPCRSSLSGAGS